MLQQQSAILDNTSEIICTISEGRTLDLINPAVEAVLGHTPENLTGVRFLSLVLPKDAEATTRALDAARAGTPQTFENRLLKADGASTSLLWSVRFVEDERSFFCVAHDISARKELEDLKQKIVSIVSHDLRSPLMSLQIKLESLAEGERGPLPAPVVAELQGAQNNIDRMVALANDLLDLQRLHAGNWVMRFRDRSILSILSESAESIQSLAESKGTRIILPAKDIIVTADGERISQVVVNFLGNAVKFSPKGKPIEITAKEINGQLEISISDYGPGISEADQKLLFERFQQGEQHDSQAKGSGLGLAICKEIVEAHGGTLGVTSQLGRGSTFWFRIPLKQMSSHAVV
jgi:PAS domain S-box-containing protein